MNTSFKLFVAVAGGLVLSIPGIRAQSSVNEGGLIGKPYAGFDFTYDRYSGSLIDKALGGTALANIPVSSTVDVGVAYTYADASGANDGATDNVLMGSVLTHNRTEWGKGYFSATLGHAWRRNNLFGVGTRDNGAFWGVRAGYELAMGTRAAVNLGLGYSDGFGSANYRDHDFQYRIEANYWFTPAVCGVLGGTYHQISSAPDITSYSLGFRFRY